MEEELMLQQGDGSVILIKNVVPYSVIADDIEKESRGEYYKDLREIVLCYNIYEKGAKFVTEGSNGDYEASSLSYKKSASIVAKEARFLFANTPDFNVNLNDTSEKLKELSTILQKFLNSVLKKNNFSDKLLKAAKDCFIGKRVAIVLNFNKQSGITITFLNSLEFIYSCNENGLTKIVMYYNMSKAERKQSQKWFKKTYELSEGVVYVEEKIYDGLGVEIETVTSRRKTKFREIPAAVIINDGLTGDISGVSDIGGLIEYERAYSKLANADIDAGRKNMNPTRYTIDASINSTKNLSIAPGAFWDLQSDDMQGADRQAKAGVLEPNMSYSEPLKQTLDRIENTMYSEVDVPNINSEQLQGVITSGKTLKALYWGLKVRCDEKMLAWEPALRYIAEKIIEGGKLYPDSIYKYTLENELPNISYDIEVVNNYPLPEDIEEEKQINLSEVNNQTMSRKRYMKTWFKMSDKDADEELLQIKYEMDLFENSVLPSADYSDIEEDGTN